jgi:hypothetical protein
MVFDDSVMRSVAIGLLCLLLPVGILLGRSNVKRYRQKLFRGLEESYRAAGGDVTKLSLVPSFEIARYKYGVWSEDHPSHNRIHASGIRDTLLYIIPCIIFSGVSLFGFRMAFILADQDDFWRHKSFFLLGLHSAGRNVAEYQMGTAGVVAAAFFGAYIWSILYLLKRIANFDLSPLSFLRAATQILLACFVAATLRHVAHGMTTHGQDEQWFNFAQPGMFLGLAFLVGYFPTLGIDTLIDRFQGLQLKRVDPDARKMCRTLPMDMIDGMDPSIRFRLAELEIEDVQNLATTNPVLLFMETPYGFFEAIDWVAQAQLIVAVGPEKALPLRNLCIRTVFDLDNACSDPQMQPALAEILFAQITTQAVDAASVKTLCVAINENLYVRRLRQLWNVIYDVLTPVAARETGWVPRLAA